MRKKSAKELVEEVAVEKMKIYSNTIGTIVYVVLDGISYEVKGVAMKSNLIYIDNQSIFNQRIEAVKVTAKQKQEIRERLFNLK